jgi:hypothetical protein
MNSEDEDDGLELQEVEAQREMTTEEKVDFLYKFVMDQLGGAGVPGPPQGPEPPPPEPPPLPPPIEGPLLPYRESFAFAYSSMERFDVSLAANRGVICPSIAIEFMASMIFELGNQQGFDFYLEHEKAWVHARNVLNDIASKVAELDEDKRYAMPLAELKYGNETAVPLPLMYSRLASIGSRFKSLVSYYETREYRSPFGELTPGEIIEIFAKMLRYLAPKTGKGIFTQRSRAHAGRSWEAQPWAEFAYRVLMQTATDLHGVPQPAPPIDPGYDPGYSVG